MLARVEMSPWSRLLKSSRSAQRVILATFRTILHDGKVKMDICLKQHSDVYVYVLQYLYNICLFSLSVYCSNWSVLYILYVCALCIGIVSELKSK